MIILEDVSKIFHTEGIDTIALNNVSLQVRRGEFVSVMGPSGCGKTTLLNVMGLVESPTYGRYLLDGDDTGPLSEKQKGEVRRKSIGFVFQSFNLIDELSVFENVEMPLVYTNMRRSERRERVEAVLEKLNMIHRLSYFPGQLSGGQQQRVAIARAIVSHPKLILADEPTGNLDTVNGEEVMKLLTSINEQGTTIVMVTHSHRDAEYGHRTINLLDGQVIGQNRMHA